MKKSLLVVFALVLQGCAGTRAIRVSPDEFLRRARAPASSTAWSAYIGQSGTRAYLEEGATAPRENVEIYWTELSGLPADFAERIRTGAGTEEKTPAAAPPQADSAPFRKIDVPVVEELYSHFAANRARSNTHLTLFLGTAPAPSFSAEEAAAFAEGMRRSQIDLAREAVVIIRLIEPAKNNRISFDAPRLVGDTLMCSIKRDIPTRVSGESTRREWALAVDPNQVKRVQLNLNFREVLTVEVQH